MIRQATLEDSRTAAELAVLLWPHHEIDDLEKGLKECIDSESGAVFIYFDEGIPVGFEQCNLRNDYVEGTESSPVGYLEGVFVKEGYRMRGIAKELLTRCEAWARGHGCSEFASDCELTNVESLRFHLQAGFEEANRIICFTKKILT